ncbi:MAG TPA: zf-HC2 domain-containing protein [Steroidobacteraceae bacterium]|nr:zf-HC2 domain-containing protein [Steroidobacteraceae bacterium]
MKVSDEMLMAYADGELAATERAQVEAALAADPELRRRVAAHRTLRTRLSATYDPVLEEPVPDRLASLVRAASPGPQTARVIPFPGRSTPSRPWRQWGSLAAGLVLGALLWQFGARALLSGPVIDRNGELLAAGSLARALSNQLAAGQSPSTPVQMGVSFLSRAGDYCRTFRLRGTEGIAGLACRQQSEWRLQVLAHTADTPASQYRQAASALPPAVLQAVTDSIAGEPLDAADEERALAHAWRAK